MKKILVIALMMLYGASSSGATFQLHYCCGKFKNIEWAPVKGDGCGNDHAMGGKPCCEYKAVSFSENKDNLRPELFVKIFKWSAAALPVGPVASSGLSVFDQPVSVVVSTQTIRHQPPLFLLHSVFRI